MVTFSDVLHFIIGPVVGCIIGMVTNYLAIIMLFRPLKPVKIGKFTLPFTPGIIPKHQSQLADALADTVAKNFFTNDDIAGIFLTDAMVDKFSESIYDAITGPGTLDKIKNVIPEEKREDISVNAKALVYSRIHKAIWDAPLNRIVANETEKIIRTKTQDRVLASAFLNESRTAALAAYIGSEVQKYIRENDLEIMAPILTQQGDSLKGIKLLDVCEEIGVDRELVKNLIRGAYVDFMGRSRQGIAETFHIREFIHDKIMELNPADIEFLVNSAIKREMNYLVYLGGGLGFIIGLINSFI